MQRPGAKHGGDDNPHTEVGDDLAIELVEDAPTAGRPQPGEETTGHKDAVPIDFETADAKGNGIHAGD